LKIIAETKNFVMNKYFESKINIKKLYKLTIFAVAVFANFLLKKFFLKKNLKIK
tara:strand:+ start:424 stop:585 length:162 start_codon:yes stop_codon:yes gene_type:complete